jgi:hypothetical protein
MAGMSPSEVSHFLPFFSISTHFFMILQKRLQKELMSLMKEPPPGVAVDFDLAEQNLLQ